MKRISIVIPVYNEEDVLLKLNEKLNNLIETVNEYEFEIIFVNDGSKDKSLSILEEMSKSNTNIKVISSCIMARGTL